MGTPYIIFSSVIPAGLTQPLRFTASFPWSPRQSTMSTIFPLLLLLIIVRVVNTLYKGFAVVNLDK